MPNNQMTKIYHFQRHSHNVPSIQNILLIIIAVANQDIIYLTKRIMPKRRNPANIKNTLLSQALDYFMKIYFFILKYYNFNKLLVRCHFIFNHIMFYKTYRYLFINPEDYLRKNISAKLYPNQTCS